MAGVYAEIEINTRADPWPVTVRETGQVLAIDFATYRSGASATSPAASVLDLETNGTPAVVSGTPTVSGGTVLVTTDWSQASAGRDYVLLTRCTIGGAVHDAAFYVRTYPL